MNRTVLKIVRIDDSESQFEVFTGGNGIACCGPVAYLCGKLLWSKLPADELC